MNLSKKIVQVANLLPSARSILFITGAGISADSGLPNYRGTGSLYNGEVTEEGMSIEHALSADVFDFRPEVTWKYLAQIEKLCGNAEPNVAHLGIVALENMGKFVMVGAAAQHGLKFLLVANDISGWFPLFDFIVRQTRVR
jgi:NAD-dependent deacetylase